MAEVQVHVPNHPRKTVSLRDKKEKKLSNPDDVADLTKWKFVDKHELQDPHKDYVQFNKRPDTIKEFSKSKKHRYDEQESSEDSYQPQRRSTVSSHYYEPHSYPSLSSSVTKDHLLPKGKLLKSPKRRTSYKSWENNFQYLSEFLTDEEKKILIEELEEIGIPRPPSAIWRPATVPPAPPLSAAHIGLFHLRRSDSEDNVNQDSPLTARDMDYQPRPHSQTFSRQRPEVSLSFEGNSNPFLPAPSFRRLERVPSFSELPLATINNMLNSAPTSNLPMNGSAPNLHLDHGKRLERSGSVSDMLGRPRPRASTLPERLLDQPLPSVTIKDFPRLDLPPSSPLKNSNAMLSPSSKVRASKKLPLKDSLGLLSAGFEPEPEPTGRDLFGRSSRGNQFVLEVQELTEVPSEFGPNSSLSLSGSSHMGTPFVIVTSPSCDNTQGHTPVGAYLGVPQPSKSRATTPNHLSAPRSASREKKLPSSPDSVLPRIGTELRPFKYKEKFDILMSNFSKAVTITDITDEEWKQISQTESGTGAESPHSQSQEVYPS